MSGSFEVLKSDWRAFITHSPKREWIMVRFHVVYEYWIYREKIAITIDSQSRNHVKNLDGALFVINSITQDSDVNFSDSYYFASNTSEIHFRSL